MQLSQMEGQSAIVSAARWLEQLLTGTTGAVIATIVVATMGFAMLQGRLSPRHAFRVILGCFVLFGAPSIASGITSAARNYGTAIPPAAQAVTPPMLPTAAPQFDPYAGAATPR